MDENDGLVGIIAGLILSILIWYAVLCLLWGCTDCRPSASVVPAQDREHIDRLEAGVKCKF